jgi:hypothetical protein
MNDLIAFMCENTPSLLADLHGFHSLACFAGTEKSFSRKVWARIFKECLSNLRFVWLAVSARPVVQTVNNIDVFN